MKINKWIKYIKEFNSNDQVHTWTSFIDGKEMMGEPRTQSILDMDTDEMNDVYIDIFDELKQRTKNISNGSGTSLLITGQSGLGKSYEVEQAIKEVAKENKDLKYDFFSGGASLSGLFEILFTRNGRLLVFDDFDSVFKTDESVNMLKAALDSKEERTVSRQVKTHFDTDGMTMNDIMGNYEGDQSMCDNPDLFDSKNTGKMPKSFTYTGRVIFISNIPGDKMDKNIVTRVSAHIDIHLSYEEILTRMKMVMKFMHPKVSYEKKEEVLNLIDYLSRKYETRHPLSIRGLSNAIRTRIANDFNKVIKGRNIPMWQILLKQDMLGKNPKKRK